MFSECWVLISIVASSLAAVQGSTALIPLPLPVSAPMPPLPLEHVNGTITNATNLFIADLAKDYSYCCVDGKKDQESAFPSDQPLPFSECPSVDDPSLKLCTKEEVKMFFAFILPPFAPISSLNCNPTNWSRGCEPGWCSSIQAGEQANIYLGSTHYVPKRNGDPQPCCPGFFCPRGLACMMPCPLGAYCPLSSFNPSWQACDPYGYQLTPNTPGSYCGGAHLWADVGWTGQVFCSPGYYCPNATAMLPCESGHYCRMGSSKQKKCFPFVHCGPGSEVQNIEVYGYMLIAVLAATVLILYGCSDQLMIIQEKRRSRAREKGARQARESVSSSAWEAPKTLARRLSSGLARKVSASSGPEEMQVLVSGSPQPVTDEQHHESSDKVGTSRPRTRSQIFNYAYGQLEKEKLHSLDIQCRPRPRINISFEDLTLTLKKNGMKILCNVTGQLLPGRITAVMGPSGAGKTAFLAAIAGKATQSKITGQVLINGKQVAIQSFKKIIGFVPQDDIVHGLLTVEENLYFSAKYRLPCSLPKQEVVLVIERTINSLGLDSVRNSLVGTVESRGISGGQRKRVNVGLEMVIEPSLLILDEPTSGLDSTSSRLVVEALRREASSSVNIVVVLHQPNYKLFRMFDDLMLLAKGGRVAYLGPVENVESYFTALGFPVPEWVSPPDHLMDVLEGTAPIQSGQNLQQATLPIMWMQHKGYTIPPNLQAQAGLLGESSSSHSHETTAESSKKTLSQEAWEEVKDPMVVFLEGIRSAFPTTEDLSGRKTPGFRKQYGVILERILKQRFQEARLLTQDYMILLMAGIGMGLLSDARDETLGAAAYTFTIIAISLLGMIAALRTFSLDKLHYWRESASGINRVAYFLAKDTLDHLNTVLKPLVYLSMFYFLIDSRSTFISNYLVTVALLYCVTGLAYIFAIMLQPSTAQLISVLLPVVETLVASKKRDTTAGFMAFIIDMTFARWAFEAYIVSNAERYDGVWLITRCGILRKFGYRLDRKYVGVCILLFHGLAARGISLGCLLFCNRSRQR